MLPSVAFLYSLKHQKTIGFLMFAGGINRQHWAIMVSKVCWQIHLLQCHGQFFSRYIHAFKERSLLFEVFLNQLCQKSEQQTYWCLRLFLCVLLLLFCIKFVTRIHRQFNKYHTHIQRKCLVTYLCSVFVSLL